jgi:hypothetical protein
VIHPTLLGGVLEGPQTLYSVATGDDDFTPPLRVLEAPSPEVTRLQESWHSGRFRFRA